MYSVHLETDHWLSSYLPIAFSKLLSISFSCGENSSQLHFVKGGDIDSLKGRVWKEWIALAWEEQAPLEAPWGAGHLSYCCIMSGEKRSLIENSELPRHRRRTRGLKAMWWQRLNLWLLFFFSFCAVFIFSLALPHCFLCIYFWNWQVLRNFFFLYFL